MQHEVIIPWNLVQKSSRYAGVALCNSFKFSPAEKARVLEASTMPSHLGSAAACLNAAVSSVMRERPRELTGGDAIVIRVILLSLPHRSVWTTPEREDICLGLQCGNARLRIKRTPMRFISTIFWVRFILQDRFLFLKEKILLLHRSEPYNKCCTVCCCTCSVSTLTLGKTHHEVKSHF